MKEEAKLDALRVWLHDHHIGYNEAYNLDGVECDLWISLYRIAVIADASRADEVYPRLTQNHARAFFIRETESNDFVVEKMQNCIKDVRLKRALRYVWKRLPVEQKTRNYKGGWPLNFGKFKKDFDKVLITAEYDLDTAVSVFLPKTEKEAWL